MALSEIKFEKTGGPITVEVRCGYAPIAALYSLFLREANKNKTVMKIDGDFMNPEDDYYELPTPNIENDGRRVVCIVHVIIEGDQYHSELRFYQDGRELKPRVTVSGNSDKIVETLILVAKLKAEEES